MAVSSEVIFTSSLPVELHSVEGEKRTPLIEAPEGASKAGHVMVLEALKGTGKNYPMLAARATIGPVGWVLKVGSHTMRSSSSNGEPSFIFSMVDEKNPELFYCVVMQKGTPKEELDTLGDILGKLTTFHATKPKGPPIPLPNLNINPGQINEILRKGAEDTQHMLQQAGQAAGAAFAAAAEMHKKYAPKPHEQPAEVNPAIRDKIAKTKQATAAGAAVARGVATGMQAATVEIGTTLLGVGKDGKDGKGGKAGAGASSSEGGLASRPEVKAAGGLGMELLRDVAAVRDAMVQSVGAAWGGLRSATVDVFEYQYGDQAAAAAADSCDVVEGIASMGMAMKLTQPTQVLLTSAKGTSNAAEGAGKQEMTKDQLAAEKAALEREKAAFEREKAALEKAKGQQGKGQQQRGPFGLPFGFGGSQG